MARVGKVKVSGATSVEYNGQRWGINFSVEACCPDYDELDLRLKREGSETLHGFKRAITSRHYADLGVFGTIGAITDQALEDAVQREEEEQ